MQSNVSATRKQSTTGTEPEQSCKPELIEVEVANIQGEVVIVSSKPQDGSALEAAAELHKLTGVLSEKAAEIKELADQAFLGGVTPNLETGPITAPDAIDELHLHSEVKEAVDDLRDKIADVKCATQQPATVEQAANHAEALDKVVEVLETSKEQIKDLKVALIAKELNNMDGFDR